MKNTIFKSILALAMAFMALPMMGQDYLSIYFKDGHRERHFMHLVKEITTSKYDLDGNLHSDYQLQQIVMEDTTYSYYIADIDSMSFRKVDEEQVKNNIVDVISTVEPIYEMCSNIGEMEKHIDEIRNMESVEYVKTSGNDIIIQIKDSRKIFYHFHDEEELMLASKRATPRFLAKENRQINALPVNSYKPLKVCIANQCSYDLNHEEGNKNIDNIVSWFESLKYAFEVEYVPNERFDLDFIQKRIYNNNIVYLQSHGGYEDGRHWLMLGQRLTKDEMSRIDVSKEGEFLYDLDYIAWVTSSEMRIKDINETFYYYYVPEEIFGIDGYPFQEGKPTVILNGACLSMAGDKDDKVLNSKGKEFPGNSSMANKFIQHGADVYIGFNVSQGYAPASFGLYLRYLLSGMSHESALYELLYNVKFEELFDVTELSPIEIVAKQVSYNNFMQANREHLIDIVNEETNNPQGIFIVKTETIQTTDEEAQKSFNEEEKVDLIGVTTMLERGYPNVICGFRYGTDPNLNTFTSIEATKIVDTDAIGYNVAFSASITPEQFDKKTYYRAYTYDGMNYNLADNIYDFTVSNYQNLALEYNSINLTTGETKSVQITSGSGNYSIESVIPSDVVTASISESRITLEAHKAGTANITVKDNISGKTATLSVTVTEYTPSNRPAIDLALPSGTLWASCNVGATEPEDFGGYYAWGETEEKSNYDWDSYIFNISSEYSYNMTKYCTDSRYGTLDNKTTLDPEDDVAHVEWGGNWRMPTTEEIDELMANCSQEWTISKGVWGCKFTGSNGNFIFLPAAGYKLHTQLNYNGTRGTYWSSSLNTNNPNTSYDLRISGEGAVEYFQNRYIGQCVRPVMSNSIPPADLSLSSYTMELTSGETKTVTITSGSGNYTVESNDPNVAQADEKDGLVTIIGRRPSTVPAIITVTDNVTTQTATITVTVVSATDYSTGEAIDLGLPSGTLWASCNIGASSEVEAGSFFAWGETEAKQTFYRSNYQYYDSSTETYKSLGYNISGTQYDAAHVIWGGAWRMPSMADFRELRDNCQSKWTTFKGVICKQYIGPNGKSIYLPAAGYYSGDVLKEKDETGNYWSADLYPKDEKCAYLIVTENSSQNTTYYGGRSLGATIRPVQKTSIPEEDRITQVIPEEFLDLLDDHITIYNGNNPPIIEGEYLVKPCTMQYDSDGDFSVGHEFTPKQIKVSNQDILNNTIDYEEKQGSSVAKGIGSFISGDGDNFSVFFNIEGVDYFSEYDVYTKKAMIVSGIKTANGIRNLAYAFIITSKSDDPQNKIMDVGDYRVIRDGDGLAENYPWNAQSPSKKRSINESETLLLEDTNDSSATRKRATGKNNVVRVVRKE